MELEELHGLMREIFGIKLMRCNINLFNPMNVPVIYWTILM